MKNSLTTILFTVLFSPLVNASQKLSCDLLPLKGKVQIEILNVEGRPDLKMIHIDIVSNIYNHGNTAGDTTKPAGLSGYLATQVNEEGYVMASGTVFNSKGAELIVNPETVTIQGSLAPRENGVISLSLYDDDRILQLGFGAFLNCTLQK